MKSLTAKDLKWLEQTLAELHSDITIAYFTDAADCRHCRQERELLTELADLSHKLHLEIYNFTADHETAAQHGIDKVPGIVLVGEKDYGIRYYGTLSDFEFSMLLEDMHRISTGQSGLSEKTKNAVKNLPTPLHLEVLTTPSCPFSEGAMRVAHQIAMEKADITADLVNVEDFPELIQRYNMRAAPTVVVNKSKIFYGALSEGDLLTEIHRSLE